MEYTVQIGAEAVVLNVQGRVDEARWEAFGHGLAGAVQQARNNGLAKVVIDLQRLEYMSSRGLRVLTVAKRQADEAGIDIHLASPNRVMREILAISRYDKLFTILGEPDATP